MESEDFLRRPQPSTLYVLNVAILTLPTSALRTTVSLLRRAGLRESGVFWYGPRDKAGNGLVRAVIAPRQAMSRGNYHVSAKAMSAMIAILSDSTWKPLAQIHSHPGSGVEHSCYDDEMVATTRALSIVFPYYGRWSGPWPLGVGVHEHQNDYWHLLSADNGLRRIQLSAEAVFLTKDLRW